MKDIIKILISLLVVTQFFCMNEIIPVTVTEDEYDIYIAGLEQTAIGGIRDTCGRHR